MVTLTTRKDIMESTPLPTTIPDNATEITLVTDLRHKQRFSLARALEETLLEIEHLRGRRIKVVIDLTVARADGSTHEEMLEFLSKNLGEGRPEYYEFESQTANQAS